MIHTVLKKERQKTSRLSLLAAAILFSVKTMAQVYPAGFSQVKVADVTYPTSMAFAPDGRIFVAEKAGKVKIIKNGVKLGTSFLTVNVSETNERGLGSIALDPNFSSNGYVYVYYTTASEPIHNRLSRFTANGDVAVPGSETVLLDLDPVVNSIHNSGGMVFGNDGKLYIGIGEDHVPANAQNLNTCFGKVLRLNKDGSTPGDNPYQGGAATRRIWCYGFRNPFTLAIQPGTGRIFANDVGEATWEEINDVTQGNKNFGWSNAEGNSNNPAYTNPVYTYHHGQDDTQGCAISGGTFFNPDNTNYPNQYIGKYFFLDYCGSWLNYINTSGEITKTTFATGLPSSKVCLKTGTDGNLYFFSLNTSSLYKIIYTNNNAPQINSQPVSLTRSVGQSATFSVSASGAQPLAYQWRKNGNNIAGATSSSYTIAQVQYSDSGNYSVKVSNNNGTVYSNNAKLTITGFNARPTATILTPADNSTYRGGDVISFSGNGTDPEDGNLAAGAFTWYVEFHHDQHIHPGPSISPGIKNGSFAIPSTGETSANVYYRLVLVVEDHNGSTDTDYVDIRPIKSNLTVASSPAGLLIQLDGQPKTAPYTEQSVSGMVRSIGVVSPQAANGTNYVFDHWVHGGPAAQDVTITDNNTTYTAVYKESGGAGPKMFIALNASWKYLDNGSNQGTAWRAGGFNDGTWKTGNAELGYGDGDEAKVISYGNNANNKFITTYFRKTFSIDTVSNYSSFELNLLKDDGAVVYVNGVEVVRTNMPGGSIGYTTLASSSLGAPQENAFTTYTIPSSKFMNGSNTIAVEVHQGAANSSDLSFNLSLKGITGNAPQPDVNLISAGTSWKYLDNGTNQGTNWKSPTFSDVSWKSGNAELGYGDGGEATVVSYGGDAGKKYITTYFRKNFNVSNPSAFTALELGLIRDDGAAVYINGVEVYRNNLPGGAIYYNTLAPTYIDGANESAWLMVNVSKASIVQGNNVIAVEIHQNAPTSSDISFNLKLKGINNGNVAGKKEDEVPASPADSLNAEKGDFVLYPNPSNGNFTMEYCNENIQANTMDIDVVSATGQVVFRKTLEKKEGCVIEVIELEKNLAKGIYIMNINADGKRESKRMVLAND